MNTKGDVLRALKITSKKEVIKEVYFSKVKHNKIKGWKYHKKMTLRLCVPVGKVKFVFYDEKNFLEITIGEKNYKLIIVPANIWFSFKGLSKVQSLIVNMPNILHSKNEQRTKKIKDIKYEF